MTVTDFPPSEIELTLIIVPLRYDAFSLLFYLFFYIFVILLWLNIFWPDKYSKLMYKNIIYVEPKNVVQRDGIFSGFCTF